MRPFDYIITGAGSAGCVLASRLTEDPSIKVLLIEAGGGDGHPFIHIPAGFTKLSIPATTWGFHTVPQKELNGRELLFPQARILGGGSTINAMIYTRGSRHDYDEWATLGCDQWSYQQVLPYFRKAESNQRLADEFHGTQGPLHVSDPVTVHPITYAMLKAAQQLGLPFTSDFNGTQQEGAGFYQTTTHEGRRASAAACYLRPARRRSNLVLRLAVSVLSIEIEGGRATGVRLRRPDGRVETVRAEREVLVTSGAIGSPKLLMCSGIGPADHLRQVGFDIVHDLPGVGGNLQDHLNVSVVGECSGPNSYFGASQWSQYPWWGMQYLLHRSGPLTTNASESGAFVKSDPALQAPDLQLHFMTGPVVDPHVERMAMYGVTLGTNVSRPLSRGSVRLRGPDPGEAPLIDPNYLAEPDDLRRAIIAFKFARDMLQSPALRPLMRKEYSPGLQVRSDAEITAFIRQSGKTDYHPVGTCRMGSDREAVVDQALKVHGLDGLRVCDSSIMPTEITGNTNAPTIMIAERAAAFIAHPPDHLTGA